MGIWRRFRQLRRNQRGVTALEFAIVAPLFFLVVALGIEVIFSLLADATLESAAARITRMGKIGMFVGQDCQTAVETELKSTLRIWVNKQDVHVNAKIYKPGEAVTFDDKDGKYDPVCDTGDRGDMVVFRLGFSRPALTGALSLVGVHLLSYERIAVIQNEP